MMVVMKPRTDVMSKTETSRWSAEQEPVSQSRFLSSIHQFCCLNQIICDLRMMQKYGGKYKNTKAQCLDPEEG